MDSRGSYVPLDKKKTELDRIKVLQWVAIGLGVLVFLGLVPLWTMVGIDLGRESTGNTCPTSVSSSSNDCQLSDRIGCNACSCRNTTSQFDAIKTSLANLSIQMGSVTTTILNAFTSSTSSVQTLLTNYFLTLQTRFNGVDDNMQVLLDKVERLSQQITRPNLYGVNSSCASEACRNASAEYQALKNGPMRVEYDQTGRLFIYGGQSAPAIFRVICKEYARNRLSLLYQNKYRYSGRAAELFGPSQLNADIIQRATMGTDAELLSEFSQLHEDTQAKLSGCVDGFNDWLVDVNADPNRWIPYDLKVLGITTAPLEPFTIVDLLRSILNLLRSFTQGGIPSFQLTNLLALRSLITLHGIDNATKIFDDINPPTSCAGPVYILDGVDSRCQQPPPSSFVYTASISSGTDPDGDTAAAAFESLAAVLDSIEEDKRARGLPSTKTDGTASYGVSVGPKKSARGTAMMSGGPQTPPVWNSESQGFWVHVDSPGADLESSGWFIPGTGFPIGATHGYSVSIQVGHLPSGDLLYESSTNSFPRPGKPTETFTVKQTNGTLTNTTVSIFRSTSGGYVLPANLFNPAPPAGMVLTWRTVFLDKQVRALDFYLQALHAHTLEEYLDLVDDPALNSDLSAFEVCYADARGNYGYLHTGTWSDLPAYDRRFPQGAIITTGVTTMVPTNVEYTYENIARNAVHEFNGGEGFYSGWNSLMRRGLPLAGTAAAVNSVRTTGMNRAYWIQEWLRNKCVISWDDLESIPLHVGVCGGGNAITSLATNYNADQFRPFFLEKTRQAIVANPTSSRLQALQLFQDYKGYWIPTNNTFGMDFSDAHILASRFVHELVVAVVNPSSLSLRAILRGTTLQVTATTAGSSLATVASQNAGDFYVMLIARALGIEKESIFGRNLIPAGWPQFQGWLGGQPSTEVLLLNALDSAWNSLANVPRPWGKNARTFFNYTVNLGAPTPTTVYTEKTFHRSTVYLNVEWDTCGPLNARGVGRLGQSQTIYGTPPGAYTLDVHALDQTPFYDAFVGLPFPWKQSTRLCKAARAIDR